MLHTVTEGKGISPMPDWTLLNAINTGLSLHLSND